MLLNTIYEEITQKARAEIHETDGDLNIWFYDMSGILVETENFHGKSLPYVESAAWNWARGLKQLRS